VKIEENSRPITTFFTPFELFRYNASPEQYQYIIQQALAGLAEVQNMADDIILFASNRLEHDERLKALLLRFKQVM